MVSFADELKDALALAREFADRTGHSEVSIDHLVVAMLAPQPSSDGEARTTLAADLLTNLDFGVSTLFQLWLKDHQPATKHRRRPSATFGAEAAFAIERADRLADGSPTTTAHLLIAIAELIEAGTVPPGWFGDKLRRAEVTAAELAKTWAAMNAALDRLAEPAPSDPSHWQTCAHLEHAYGEVTTDLTVLARVGALDPVVGRDREIDRVVAILSRRTKNNPVLIGEPGVGKTAIVEGLAQRIASGTVPDSIKGRRLIQITTAHLVAGTRYRGDFEGKIADLIAAIRAMTPPPILFIDELHTIVGAGAGEENESSDLANYLKPFLARGELSLIGATTLDEYRRVIEADAALERRFAPIIVDEPSAAETRTILEGLVGRYGAHHGVAYDPSAIAAAVDLADRHLDRRFPDKAIDLIDEAGAMARIAGRAVVTDEDVRDVVSRWLGTTKERLTPSTDRLRTLSDRLAELVVGQRPAIEAVATILRMRQLGLTERRGPFASFVFAGPAGSGKTTLAEVLADEVVDGRLVVIDLATYTEPHTIASLIGAPAGYVGYDEPARLVEPVRRHRRCLVLFEHADAAHPVILRLIEDILRTGQLADTKGRIASFRDAIVVLTVDANETKTAIGFGRSDGPSSRVGEAIGATIESLVDAVVPFAKLDEAAIIAIADRHLASICEAASKRHAVNITVNPAVLPALVAAGRLGRRTTIQRLVEERIEQPLAEAISHAKTASFLVDIEGSRVVVRPTT